MLLLQRARPARGGPLLLFPLISVASLQTASDSFLTGHPGCSCCSAPAQLGAGPCPIRTPRSISLCTRTL